MNSPLCSFWISLWSFCATRQNQKCGVEKGAAESSGQVCTSMTILAELGEASNGQDARWERGNIHLGTEGGLEQASPGDNHGRNRLPSVVSVFHNNQNHSFNPCHLWNINQGTTSLVFCGKSTTGQKTRECSFVFLILFWLDLPILNTPQICSQVTLDTPGHRSNPPWTIWDSSCDRCLSLDRSPLHEIIIMIPRRLELPTSVVSCPHVASHRCWQLCNCQAKVTISNLLHRQLYHQWWHHGSSQWDCPGNCNCNCPTTSQVYWPGRFFAQQRSKTKFMAVYSYKSLISRRASKL